MDLRIISSYSYISNRTYSIYTYVYTYLLFKTQERFIYRSYCYNYKLMLANMLTAFSREITIPIPCQY